MLVFFPVEVQHNHKTEIRSKQWGGKKIIILKRPSMGFRSHTVKVYGKNNKKKRGGRGWNLFFFPLCSPMSNGGREDASYFYLRKVLPKLKKNNSFKKKSYPPSTLTHTKDFFFFGGWKFLMTFPFPLFLCWFATFNHFFFCTHTHTHTQRTRTLDENISFFFVMKQKKKMRRVFWMKTYDTRTHTNETKK